jgi:hypothetical protein
VVKGKAYIFGGDVWEQEGDDATHAVTLPSGLEEKDIGYQSIPPAAAPDRPLANSGDGLGSSSQSQTNLVPVPRAAHTAAAAD